MEKIFTFKYQTDDEAFEAAQSIHNQLIGNRDYIGSNIILNWDTNETVTLAIGDECETHPEITITL